MPRKFYIFFLHVISTVYKHGKHANRNRKSEKKLDLSTYFLIWKIQMSMKKKYRATFFTQKNCITEPFNFNRYISPIPFP